MEQRETPQPKHAFLVRIPVGLYLRLKHFAVDARKSLAAVVQEAIEQYLDSGR